jgi:versiconal hemiacetal acetate esterase
MPPDSIDPNITDPAQVPALSNSLTQYPPIYIATCEFDPLHDDGKVMEHILKKAGVKVKFDYYEGYPHYFWNFPSISDGQKLYRT